MPAPPPSSGMDLNLDNPSASKTTFFVALSLMLFLTLLAVGARLVVKIYITKSMQLEDYLSVAAWLGYISWMAFLFIYCNLATGRHQRDISLLDNFHILRIGHIAETLYIPIMCTGKASILVQFLRIFVPGRQGMIFRIIHFVIWSNVVFYLGSALTLIFRCTPKEKLWHPDIPGRCFSVNIPLTITGCWNILSDISILIIPLHCIWLLQIPIERKLGVSAVFATGLLVCVSSICRFIYIVKYLLNPQESGFQAFGMWSVVEITGLIICGCLPVLPRFREVFKRKSSHASPNGHPYKMDRTRGDKNKCNSLNPSQSSRANLVKRADVPLSERSATAVLSQGANEDDNGHEGINKTVHIETQSRDDMC